MNIKVKTTFIMIITLVIGIIIGAMLNRALLQNRIRKTFALRNPEGLVVFLERILRPDPAQSEVLIEILNKHAARVSEIRANFLEQMLSANEALRAEMDPILTPKQKRRLERRMFRPRWFQGPPQFPIGPPEKINVYIELSVLKERLGLTKDQALQVKQILEKSRNRMEKIRREIQRPMEIKQIIEELQEKKEEAIEKLLTEDQKKLYSQIKMERYKKIEGEMHRRRKIRSEQDYPRF